MRVTVLWLVGTRREFSSNSDMKRSAKYVTTIPHSRAVFGKDAGNHLRLFTSDKFILDNLIVISDTNVDNENNFISRSREAPRAAP